MLDHLSGGRLEIGTGIGVPQELARLNISMDEARAISVEAADILDQALETGVVSYRGKHFNYDKLRLVPRPAQTPHPPKWTTIVSADSARKSARRRSKICTGFNPTEQINGLFDAYRAEAAACGFAFVCAARAASEDERSGHCHSSKSDEFLEQGISFRFRPDQPNVLALRVQSASPICDRFACATQTHKTLQGEGERGESARSHSPQIPPVTRGIVNVCSPLPVHILITTEQHIDGLLWEPFGAAQLPGDKHRFCVVLTHDGRLEGRFGILPDREDAVLAHEDRWGPVTPKGLDDATTYGVVPNDRKWTHWDIAAELVGDGGQDARDRLTDSCETTGIVRMRVDDTSDVLHVLVDVGMRRRIA